MFFRCVGAFALVAAIAAPAAAQDEKVEASFLVGYTASDGIDAANTRIIQGKPYNEVAPVSGGSWGFTFGVFVNHHAEVEFLYSRQSSQLEANGTVGTLKLADLAVTDIDVNFVYNWGAPGGMIRPYAFGGLGATRYIPGTLAIAIPPGALQQNIDTLSKFAFTWGGGVKIYPTPKVGFKVQARLTPTYIQSNATGIWCDPYYGACWTVGNAQYSNQFEFAGGVTVRFP
jgi:opacity protein-like surface antigen